MKKLEWNLKYKKSYRHILKRLGDIIKFIHYNKQIYPMRLMCKFLHMPKSTYYQSHQYAPFRRMLKNETLKDQILKNYTENNRRYQCTQNSKNPLAGTMSFVNFKTEKVHLHQSNINLLLFSFLLNNKNPHHNQDSPLLVFHSFYILVLNYILH